MTHIEFSAASLSKVFNRRVIFQEISFSLLSSQSLAITGKNGSGKSTLAKILCGLLSPTGGEIRCAIDGRNIPLEKFYNHVGLVSPYINMYEEFSGLENLLMFSRIRNLPSDAAAESDELLRRFGIFERRNDPVRTYSSGMKQRLKYAAAVPHRPVILVLDEPTANLDDEGIAEVRKTMRAQVEKGILIVATNDKEDLSFTEKILNLDTLKPAKKIS